MPARVYDVEADNLFLGCVLKDPGWAVMYADQVPLDDLHIEARLVWQACLMAVADRASPTIHEIVHRLGKMQHGPSSTLDFVTREYVEGLPNALVANGIHDTKKIGLFVNRVLESADRALLAEIHEDFGESLGKSSVQFNEIWNAANMKVLEKRKKRSRANIRLLADFWPNLQPALEAWFEGQPYMRVPTGWRKLDTFIGGGLLKTGLHILAGPPGTSKTTTAVLWSKKQAEMGYTVGWSSLEMSGDLLLLRLLCSMANVDWAQLMGGQLKGNKAVQNALREAQERLSALPILVDDRDNITTDDVHQQGLLMSLLHSNLAVWYIDFADLLQDIGQHELDKAAKIYSRSKHIAKLLDIAIVVIAHTKKMVEESATKIPWAAAVKYAGHNVADFVLMTWDPYDAWVTGAFYGDVIEKGADWVLKGVRDGEGNEIVVNDPNMWYLSVAKGRLSKKGILRFHYNREVGRISDTLERRGF